MRLIALIAFSTILFDSNLGAQEAESTATRFAPQLVMVVKENVTLKDGSKVVGKAGIGETLTVTAVNGNWFWSPAHQGWIWQKHFLPLEKAIEFFTAKIKEKPTTHAHHQRGLAWKALNKNDAALADFSLAVKLDSANEPAWINRGNLHRETGEYAKAVEDYSAALNLNPRNARAYNNRGLAYSDQDRWSEAIGEFDRAIQVDRNFADAYNNRGVARRMQNQLDAALEDYNRSVELNPEHAQALGNRAYVLKQTGKYHAAAKDYDAALRLSPKSPMILNDFAWLLATCSDKEARDGQKAVSLATRACELTEPPYSDANFLDTLAAAHAEAGNFGAAVKWGTKAAEATTKDERADVLSRLKLFKGKKAFHTN